MTDPTLNVDHPLYWQLKCYELREQRDDSAHQCFVAKKELSELQARLEAAERDAAKWKQYHGELCTVEIELRTCIHALLETATPDEQTKATLYGFDLWPRCSVTKAIDAARGTT